MDKLTLLTQPQVGGPAGPPRDLPARRQSAGAMRQYLPPPPSLFIKPCSTSSRRSWAVSSWYWLSSSLTSFYVYSRSVSKTFTT